MTQMVTQFIAGFVVRRLLGPLTMGYFSELMLILQYGKFHHLGVLNALEREIPFYNSKGLFSDAESFKKVSLFFILITSFHIMILLWAISLLNSEFSLGLRLISLLILFETLIAYFQTLFQSAKQFKRWGSITAIISGIDLLLRIVLVVEYGVIGLIIALILSSFFTLLLYIKWGNTSVDWRMPFELNKLYQLIRLGIPLLISRIFYLISRSLDRILILFFLGRLSLGYYSIASMVLNCLITLPTFSVRPLTPKFLESFGKRERLEDVEKYLRLPNEIFGKLLAFIIGLVILLLPLLVELFLPQYKEGIQAAQWIAFSTFFSALVYPWNMLLISQYRQNRMAVLSGIGALLTLIWAVFFIGFLKMNIEGMALAMIISQFCFTTIRIVDGYRQYTSQIIAHIKLLSRFYFPVIWIIFSWIQTLLFYNDATPIATNDLLFKTMSHVSLFLLLSSPLLFSILKNIRTIQSFQWTKGLAET